MLTVRRDALDLSADLPTAISPDQPQRVISNAANLLSSLSHFVGVVMVPKRSTAFRHIEFLGLSEHRVLVIIVSPDGDVQNRVVHTQTTLTASQLTEASNFLNTQFAGLALDVVKDRLRLEVDNLRTEIASLMQTAVDAGVQAVESQAQVVIAGERNLLSVSDYSNDLGNLRRMFDLFEQKAQLMQLLDVSSQADGVRIFIGGKGRWCPTTTCP